MKCMVIVKASKDREKQGFNPSSEILAEICILTIQSSRSRFARIDFI